MRREGRAISTTALRGVSRCASSTNDHGGGPGTGLRDLALGESACGELLARGGTGRIIYTRAALPEARPVAFVLHRGCIAFAVDDPDVAGAVVTNVVAAFEVDGQDEPSATCWSVLAVGETAEISDPAARSSVHDELAGPWAGTPGTRVLALRPRLLTGVRRAARAGL